MARSLNPLRRREASFSEARQRGHRRVWRTDDDRRCTLWRNSHRVPGDKPPPINTASRHNIRHTHSHTRTHAHTQYHIGVGQCEHEQQQTRWDLDERWDEMRYEMEYINRAIHQ